MKNKLYIGLLTGLIAPFLIILLFWLIRFNYLTLPEFIHQATVLKVQLKIISIGAFFADLGLFYLFLKLEHIKSAKGVILAALTFCFLSIIVYL